MTIDEIELYDVEAVDEILSHLSDEDANVVQRAISSLCGMITIRDKYIKELREKILQAGNILGAKTITEYETKRIPGCIQDIAPNKKWSNPQIAEELLLMNIAKAHEEMVRLIKTGRR